ncbi:2-oxoglutarate and iron-dependent oxygenase domain-containing protein [soil metagenome]
MAQLDSIPVIDLASADVNEQFRAAYTEVGFAYLSGHDIPQSLIDDVFAAAHEFHALPLSTKMKIELNEIHRGFIPINTSTDRTSTLADVRKPNQSESFMMMREAGPRDADVLAGAYLAGENQWPELAGFRTRVVAYEQAMVRLAQRLTELVAVVVGDTERIVPRSFERPTTWLRLLHYPSQSPTTPDDVYGSAPHTDFGFITLLAQDEVGGLQVQSPDGAWIDAPPRAGTFVMNVGQMLHQWSNGVLRATPHRVINRSGRERYSVPFFFDPNVATVIATLPSCIDTEHPQRFEAVVFGDYLRTELSAGYQRHSKL